MIDKSMLIASIKLPIDQILHLKTMSNRLSLERNEDMTFSDVIREALEKTFPMPKTKERELQTNKN